MTDEKSFPQILAVAVIVINENNQILLTQRENDPDKGKWQLIAGYINPGERLAEAVQRYLKEKGGIESTTSITFTGHYYDNPDRHPGKICIPLTFIVKVPNNVHINTNRVYQWFSKDELQNLDVALDNKQMILDNKQMIMDAI